MASCSVMINNIVILIRFRMKYSEGLSTVQ